MQLTRSLTRARRIAADRTALVYADRRRTWSEFEARVARLAGAMRALGVGAGDRVILLGHSSDRFLECFYATLWAGGVAAPLSTRATPDELDYLFGDLDATLFLVGDGFEKEAARWRAANGGAPVIYIGEHATPDGFIDYETILRDAAPIADAGRRGDDTAAIFYTGGTTGRPKGVMLTHANMLSNALNGLHHLGLAEGLVNLHAGPLYHVAAASRIVHVSLLAGTHVVIPRFTVEAALEAIARHRVQLVSMVPTMMSLIVHHPDMANYDLSSLRLMTYGASPMPEALIVELMEKLPHVAFAQAYGMTELSPACTFLEARRHTRDPTLRHLLRSAGQPTIGCDVRIVGPDDNELPLGEIGEIVVAGPIVMKGYWRQPEATAEALRGGYMHTGDLGYMDKDGFVYVVDRLKDVIVSGGENVSSIEVENALSKHPAVRSCAVIGVPDELWGEAVHAEIVFKDGMSASEAELIAFARDHLAHFKTPRSISFRDEMPMSGANKILKSELRKPYWAGRTRAVN